MLQPLGGNWNGQARFTGIATNVHAFDLVRIYYDYALGRHLPSNHLLCFYHAELDTAI